MRRVVDEPSHLATLPDRARWQPPICATHMCRHVRPSIRTNDDGSTYVLLSPEPPPIGWEANHVRTLPGRGWFPYLRAYGAQAAFFDGTYTYPTVEQVDSFDHFIN